VPRPTGGERQADPEHEDAEWVAQLRDAYGLDRNRRNDVEDG